MKHIDPKELPREYEEADPIGRVLELLGDALEDRRGKDFRSMHLSLSEAATLLDRAKAEAARLKSLDGQHATEDARLVVAPMKGMRS